MELYTKTLYCPDVITQEDAMIVQETLQNSPGVEEVLVDNVLHRVTVTTANQDGLRDVIYLLRDAGYAPEETDEELPMIPSEQVRLR